MIGIRLSKEAKQALEKLAKADDRTVSNYCWLVLRKHLHDKGITLESDHKG